jgi:drug/metabolite transporter (DMT)-like permease
VIANRARLVFALLYLVILNTVLYHQVLPFQAGTQRWTWLSLSGVIGLAVGDAFLFQAYLMVGARLGTLLLSLSTLFGALEAWIFFGESLSMLEIIGIALTLGGIIWVILEQGNHKSQDLRPSALGILCGVLAAIGQATGLSFFQTRHGRQFFADQRECDSHVRGRHGVVAGHLAATEKRERRFKPLKKIRLRFDCWRWPR